MRLGFDFVPFPREIWTEGIELSQSEFRLLGWFCAHLKFGKSQFDMTDDNILAGVKKDGRIYPAVGLSRNSMRAARSALIEKKLLEATQTAGGGGRGKTAQWSYRLNLSDSEENTAVTSQELRNNLAKSAGFTQSNLSNFDNAIKEVKIEAEKKEKTSVTLVLPDWVPVDAWESFIEMRKKIRNAPLTERGIRMLLTELGRLRTTGENPERVLNMATMKGWRGLFPVGENGNGNGKPRQSSAEREAQELAFIRGH
jgi:hypothetical protein